MYQLNNIDIIILIVIGVSALIGLMRGLVKEVLSIVGWVLATLAVIYLLPVLNPVISQYFDSGLIAGVVTALFILIAFLVAWILLTGQVVGKVRTSSLGSLDRMLGLFFGIARAVLLVILANILISWIIPRDKQSRALTESKYFQTAGDFAEPVEKLIPAETLESIKKKTKDLTSEEKPEENNENKSESDILFEKLAQPQIKKKLEKESELEGYKPSEQQDLNRLIDMLN